MSSASDGNDRDICFNNVLLDKNEHNLFFSGTDENSTAALICKAMAISILSGIKRNFQVHS